MDCFYFFPYYSSDVLVLALAHVQKVKYEKLHWFSESVTLLCESLNDSGYIYRVQRVQILCISAPFVQIRGKDLGQDFQTVGSYVFIRIHK